MATYRECYEIAVLSMADRRAYLLSEYPAGAARRIALAGVGKDSRHELIAALAAQMDLEEKGIRKPMGPMPARGGSVRGEVDPIADMASPLNQMSPLSPLNQWAQPQH